MQQHRAIAFLKVSWNARCEALTRRSAIAQSLPFSQSLVAI
ncbi:MAG TPA: hypothetical protein V6D11_08745 [Waterburya sp.]